MRTIEQLLHEHPFFAGLDESTIALCAGCAVNAHYEPDQYLFREGRAAEHFFVVRHGRVAVETISPGLGAVLLDTVDDGEVLGWSWLIAPHRYAFDGRAIEPTSAVTFDGQCLRGKCEADPRLGYQLMQRVAQVMFTRMQAARVRLLDLYGAPGAHAR